jgi:hypothetical protein
MPHRLRSNTYTLHTVVGLRKEAAVEWDTRAGEDRLDIPVAGDRQEEGDPVPTRPGAGHRTEAAGSRREVAGC